MSLWDKRIGINRDKLIRLSRHQALLVASICNRHAFHVRTHHAFNDAISTEKIQIINSALELLRVSVDTPLDTSMVTATIDALEAILPDEDSADSFVHGWYYSIVSLIHALQCIIAGDFAKHFVLSLDSAYQSVAEPELACAMTSSGLVGDEITKAESASILCQEEIMFQLDTLRRIDTWNSDLSDDLEHSV